MADTQTWIQTITFLFIPLLCFLIVNEWTKNDDDDDMGPGSMVPAWNGIQG